MRVLLLNGPPRSGKDTVARILKDSAPSFIHEEKFARPMKVVTPLIYGLTREKWENELDTAANKDLPCDEFFGHTPRQVQIAFSEGHMKPLHGDVIFGKLLVRRIKDIVETNKSLESVVISDSGFWGEANEVIEHFGADNVQLWKIRRKDCTFAGDSRNYIDLSDHGVRTYNIDNDGSMDDLRDIVRPLYEAMTLPRERTEGEALETEETWQQRRDDAAMKAFDDWPERKIARIKRGAAA